MKIENIFYSIVLVGTLTFPLISIFYGYDADNAKRILESSGFSKIETGNHKMFSCPQEFYATKFTAIGPTGKKVKGAVCSGIFLKDATIRFE